MSDHTIEVTVNGRSGQHTVESRRSLCDFLRVDAGQTGVHVGCEHGVCGACTVIVAQKDGRGTAVRSCLMLAVQADGCSITTVEGLAEPDGTLHPVQQAMRDNHALQCGFCTPGIVCSLVAATSGNDKPDAEGLEKIMSGHICRCTGYQGIRRAIRLLAGKNDAQPIGGSA